MATVDEIIKRLQKVGAKDSSFPIASVLTGEETLVLVQNGVNVKVPIRSVFQQLGGSSMNPDQFTAEAFAQASQQVSANVRLENGKFTFTFGIPSGSSSGGGDQPVNTRVFIIYMSTGAIVARPNPPVGGYWNSADNIFTPPVGWSTDDELDGIIWMSSGSFRADTGELIGSWSPPMRISGIDGISPNTSFKSTVFKRTNEQPQTPVGGDYNNPVPDGWSDGIPDGEEILWASTRVFSSDGKAPQQDSWTEPRQMTDTASFDVEFSSVENPNPPVGHPNTNSQWSNSADSTTIWMATSTKANGIWSPWQISRIKGEKGQDGTSIKIKGTLTDSSLLPTPPEDPSDCYLIGNDLWVWDGDSWVNAGPFKGQDGTSAYLHVKYANSLAENDWTVPNGETPGKYIGIYVDDKPEDQLIWSLYTWTKWEGEDGFGYEYIYKVTQDSTAPDTPTDVSQDNDYVPSGWTDDPTGVSEEFKYEWVCYRKKEDGIWSSFIGSSSNNAKAALWAKFGSDGKDGEDGDSIEFIYKLTKDSLTQPSLNKDDSPNQNDYVPEGWTDNPSGISEDMQAEWIASRQKTDGIWSTWEGPALWSKWGVNGKDGDGVEYIFYRNNGEPVGNPTPSDINTDQYQERGEYEGIEYVPDGWTDNPQGINEEFKVEWVSQRKYRNGTWGGFSNPSIWAKNGEDGDNGLSIRIMYAKAELGVTPPVVVDNINPGSIWGTLFPSYDNTKEAVWEIQAYVTFDNKLATAEQGATYVGWQGPWIVTGIKGDTGTPPNYKTYVYCISTSLPNKPTSNDPANPGTSTNVEGQPVTWIDYPTDSVNTWWQCIGNVNGVTGLINEDESGNLEWSEPLKVNGKDGMAQDGKKVEFRFRSHTSSISAPSIDVTSRTPSGWSTTPSKGEGEFLWMTVATINPDDTLAGNWSSPVCISGEQGPQGNDGPAGAPGPTGAQGVSGIPGVSIEVRYCLGNASSYEGSSSPSGDSPSGWQMSVPTVSETYPYIWCIQGKRTYSSASDSTGTISWGTPFRLSGINGIDGTQGKGIQNVTNYYAVGTSGTTAPNSFSTSIPTMSSTNKYLWGYEKTTYTDGSYVTTNKRVIGVFGDTGDPGQNGRGIASITEYYLATSSTSVTTSTNGWTTSIQTVNENAIYLWNYEKITWTDGSSPYLSTPVIIGTYSKGTRGQLVYPAGIYSNTTSYTTDAYKAPYVLDPSDNNFYVLNAQMTWLGTSQNNRTPSQDYAANNGKYWLKFEAFEAVYAKVGIIANGLIGSAVFNGNYMFSQQGITSSGASTSNYQNFNASDPYNSSNSFRPNFCVNLVTGETYTNAGSTQFLKNSGKIAGGAISWDSSNNVTFKGTNSSTGSVMTINPSTPSLKMTSKTSSGGTLDIITIGQESIVENDGKFTFYNPTITLKGHNTDGNANTILTLTQDGVVIQSVGTANTYVCSITDASISLRLSSPTATIGSLLLTGERTQVNDRLAYSGTYNGLKFTKGFCMGTDPSSIESGGGSSNVQFVTSLPSSPDSNTLYVLY